MAPSAPAELRGVPSSSSPGPFADPRPPSAAAPRGCSSFCWRRTTERTQSGNFGSHSHRHGIADRERTRYSPARGSTSRLMLESRWSVSPMCLKRSPSPISALRILALRTGGLDALGRPHPPIHTRFLNHGPGYVQGDARGDEPGTSRALRHRSAQCAVYPRSAQRPPLARPRSLKVAAAQGHLARRLQPPSRITLHGSLGPPCYMVSRYL
jgi:hypothetical protein